MSSYLRPTVKHIRSFASRFPCSGSWGPPIFLWLKKRRRSQNCLSQANQEKQPLLSLANPTKLLLLHTVLTLNSARSLFVVPAHVAQSSHGVRYTSCRDLRVGKLSQTNLVYIYSCCMLYVPVSEKLHVVQGSYNRGEGNQGKKQNLGKTESDMGQNECKNFSTWASLCTRSKPQAIQAHWVYWVANKNWHHSFPLVPGADVHWSRRELSQAPVERRQIPRTQCTMAHKCYLCAAKLCHRLSPYVPQNKRELSELCSSVKINSKFNAAMQTLLLWLVAILRDFAESISTWIQEISRAGLYPLASLACLEQSCWRDKLLSQGKVKVSGPHLLPYSGSQRGTKYTLSHDSEPQSSFCSSACCMAACRSMPAVL